MYILSVFSVLCGINPNTNISNTVFIPDNLRSSFLNFPGFSTRKDIGIILISQEVADRIRDTLDAYNEIIPTVLEIPSKQHPYSIEKDSIMQKALRQLYGQNIPDELKNN